MSAIEVLRSKSARRNGGVGPLGFHRQTLAIARDRDERQFPTGEEVGHRAISSVERAVNPNGVPALGMTDVLDRHVVVLAPEERDRIEALAPAEHVARRHLTLAFGDDPMLDADLRTRMRIR